nr:MAG TPA: hypothetical protein [Caudoviricetes sp.]
MRSVFNQIFVKFPCKRGYILNKCQYLSVI